MSFTVRDQAAIRAAILGNWAARYRAKGKELSIVQDSDAYSETDAFSIELEELEARSLALTHEIWPDEASDEGALRHASLIGLDRKAATAAKFYVAITGTLTSTWTTADVLSTSDGTQYKPTSNGTLVTMPQAIEVVAQTTGASTNKATGTILTWSSAPAGIASTGTVTIASFIASDQETIAELVQRILSWWRERPGSGNRSDFKTWAESRSGIAFVFVYPLDHSTLGPNTLGATRIIVTGEASARNNDAPFGLAAANITDVSDYIKGAGIYLKAGGQVPGNVDADDIHVQEPLQHIEDITTQITPGVGYAFPFSTARVVGTVTSATVFDLDSVTDIDPGDRIAIRVGHTAGLPRGGYAFGRVLSVVGSTVTLDGPLKDLDGIAITPTVTPVTAAAARPCPDNWEAIVKAQLAVFDRLGPNTVDEMTFPKSARWPASTEVGPWTLYLGALEGAARSVPGLPNAPAGVAGVVDAVVTTPGADVVPPTYYQVIPGLIVITP